MSNALDFIESDVSIKEKSYYKMGGIAKYIAFPRTFHDVTQSILFAKQKNLPIAILGAGSNSVFADDYLNGMIIALGNLSAWQWETDDILFAEAGITNTQIANICLDVECSSAFWLYRMPGQIGASVRMNARCYGGEMQHIVKDVLTINSYGHLQRYDNKQIFIGYKNTYLMHTPEIVVGVRFYFPHKSSKAQILEKMHECENDRNHKQHFLFPSCGSTFKNNHEYGKSSGRIFDELGLKGEKRGDAEVSQYHANFIWNKNSAQTQDMLELAAFMRTKAQTQLNVQLDLEVQPIGIFNQDTFASCGMQNLGFYVKQGVQYFTGFFYLPENISDESNMINTHFKFPVQIFSSFFISYFSPKESTSTKNISAEIWQLQSLSEAEKNRTEPFLRWITICDDEFQKIFIKKPLTDQDCQTLWKFSVSEIFFAHPKNTHYLECETTPYGHQLILKFNDIRKQNKNPFQHGIKLFKQWDETGKKFKFGMEFSLDDLIEYIDEDCIKVQCALSLGDEQYLLAPHWNTSNSEKADFHQPSKFWMLPLHK